MAAQTETITLKFPLQRYIRAGAQAIQHTLDDEYDVKLSVKKILERQGVGPYIEAYVKDMIKEILEELDLGDLSYDFDAEKFFGTEIRLAEERAEQAQSEYEQNRITTISVRVRGKDRAATLKKLADLELDAS